MGHSTILDIIASITVFGLLLLMVLSLNSGINEYSSAYVANSLLQKNMIKLTIQLEEDLKRVGCNASFTLTGSPPIMVADSNRLQFRGDVTGDGAFDVVEYRVGPTTDLSYTPNPSDRILFRTENGVTVQMNIGVTEFRFRYFDILNPNVPLTFPIAALGNIGPIDVSIKLESPNKMKQEYMADTSQYEMYWRQIRTISRNQQLSTAAR